VANFVWFKVDATQRNATHCIFIFIFVFLYFFIWGERDGFLERDEFAAQFGR